MFLKRRWGLVARWLWLVAGGWWRWLDGIWRRPIRSAGPGIYLTISLGLNLDRARVFSRYVGSGKPKGDPTQGSPLLCLGCWGMVIGELLRKGGTYAWVGFRLICKGSDNLPASNVPPPG
ncbi:hypothetical protein GGTG_07989 [Gaeumannomyces tritici R3-111a-1]|uniref:Uncharacterized protein n=1 Tax=Gaeumannomyces tritici (strain R3-111a-1) TaxID=644352 RepID=J3P3A1_GAET3|nr:hypothetical protein GGTG_07989 [Gaeumannomyces tritici R3-111a-1]EJT74143.1 hypothetical protein GGTG_07989 [Gaeumannomyces tritici R3-111a-1]